MRIWYFLFLIPTFLSCGNAPESETQKHTDERPLADTINKETLLYCNDMVRVGAERFDQYIRDISEKRVAVVGNQSSMVKDQHLVDTLIAQGINVTKVFSPEHGFRGKANAGEAVKDGIDPKSGLPVVSLYGKNKKPKEAQLADVDVILFDIQDVGARFYTYISTMTYVMEAAAEQGIPVIVLDRPNPNGHYVDGPVLEKKFSSFVGMHEVPVVHGMTIGEYAQMVNTEGWLDSGAKCDLKVVSCEGWDHTKFYQLPIAPSPNLPNMKAVYLYPSLCLFEGTVVSIGRGTKIPFQCVGHPDFEVDVLEDLYSFTPQPNEGSSDPKLKGETCYGYNLSLQDVKDIRQMAALDLQYLVEFYEKLGSKKDFFLSNGFINLLAGTSELKDMIVAGKSLEEIEAAWEPGIKAFREIRKKYLLYPDFE